MTKIGAFLWLCSWFSLVLPACAAELQVFAAASLSDALGEIVPAYEKENKDRVRCNFAGSNVIARQIQEGAPADLFLSADEAKMDALQKENIILPETRSSFLSNSLVVVMRSDSSVKIAAPAELAGEAIRRLALADPNAVPAGIYARSYLEKQAFGRH